MGVKTGWTGTLSLLICAVAAAQAPGEDPELARALARRGWFDLADEVCERLKSSPSVAPEHRAMVPLLQAELAMEKGGAEPDPEKAQQHMDAAATSFEAFIKGAGASPAAIDAKVSLGFLFSRKAKMRAAALEMESDPAKTATLRAAAATEYEKTEKFFKDAIESLKAGKNTDDALMDCRMELPRVMIDHAKLPGMDDGARKKLLQASMALLLDFEFDYGDRPIAFEATLETGRCLTELGEFAQAEKKLKDAVTLKVRLAEAKVPPNDYHLRIIHGAYHALAQMYLKQGRFADAKTFIDTVFKEDRTLARSFMAPTLKLEKAEAMFKLRDVAGANAIANELIKTDANGRGGYLAREKIKKWAEGGGASLGPDQLMVAADSQMERDQYREALATYRRCLEAAVHAADKAKYHPGVWFKMAQCYQGLRRNYEAAMAFENVFKNFPTDPLAAKACYEAVRVYNAEFAVSGDKKDEEQKDRLIGLLAASWPKDPAARNLRFVQAEKVEKSGDLKKAAELYMQVTEDAEAYENALVAAGYCLRVDAARKWEKAPKDPAVQKEVKDSFTRSEEVFKKFLARLKKPELNPATADLQRTRQSLALVVNQELAYLYMHEAVGRVTECIQFLDAVAKELPPDDERLSKILGALVQAHLADKKLDLAISTLEILFERFPDSPAIARSCKSVAIRLDERTQDMIQAKADPAAINENLKKVSRYYAKWLNLAPAMGLRVTMQDVLSVSEALYLIAKKLNGLDDQTTSFVDLKGRTIPEPQYWADAAFVHTLLVDGKVGKISDKDRAQLMTRLARCYGFVATDAAGWDKAKERYEGLVKAFKLVSPQGIDVNVLQQRRELLGTYLELGYVFYQLGRAGQKFQYDNASTVFSNIVRVVEPNSEVWWLSKYMVLATLFERGADADIKLAKVGLENLERNSPDFDGGKFGMKERCLDLKAKLQKVTGGK